MAVAYQYVTRNTEPPNRLVGSPAIAKKRRRIVGNDYHQIVIAVRAGFSTGGGTKQVDLLRPIQLSKPVEASIGSAADGGANRTHWVQISYISYPLSISASSASSASLRLCGEMTYHTAPA
jgi:hypothetical protein